MGVGILIETPQKRTHNLDTHQQGTGGAQNLHSCLCTSRQAQRHGDVIILAMTW